MAIKNNTAAKTNTAAATAENSWEKAKGFLNIAVPTATGEPKRLISIPLKESDAVHKQLLGWLHNEGSREARLEALLKIISISYNPVRTDAENMLALPE